MPRKCQNTCKLSNVLLNNVSNEITRESQTYLELNGHGNMNYVKICGMQLNQCLDERNSVK